MKRVILIVLSVLLLLAAVIYGFFSEPNYIPKPRGYFRIDLPEKEYRVYESDCPLSFDVSSSAKIELFRDKMAQDSCWFNIYYPRYKARIHCTYMSVHGNLDQLVEDSYEFAAKHEMRASALKRTRVEDTQRRMYGIIYDIEGEAASQLQFFLTDSSSHYFRGSLYFFNAPNPDSIAPVLSYIREDIFRIAESAAWK